METWRHLTHKVKSSSVAHLSTCIQPYRRLSLLLAARDVSRDRSREEQDDTRKYDNQYFAAFIILNRLNITSLPKG